VNRNARAEKQNAGCYPTSKRFESPADCPLHSAAAGQQQLAFIVQELVDEPGEARRGSVGVILAIHFR
jgi:hypothetical protein